MQEQVWHVRKCYSNGSKLFRLPRGTIYNVGLQLIGTKLQIGDLRLYRPHGNKSIWLHDKYLTFQAPSKITLVFNPPLISSRSPGQAVYLGLSVIWSDFHSDCVIISWAD